jgi:hypothetical protein
MAVKAALFSAVIPKVSVTIVDGGDPELEVLLYMSAVLFTGMGPLLYFQRQC